ncbi:hypothetical protein Aperf_G00000036717 [Anoplocephala perfoliata]
MALKSKSGSKGKGSKGSDKNIAYLEIPPVVLKNVRHKITCTSCDIPDYEFEQFRCARCHLVLNCFQSFIDHSCWQKYYSAKYHLGCTQTFACRACEVIFYSHTDYASHRCYDSKLCGISEWWTPEEVIPISYRQHQDYYINWAKRTERETCPHDPDYVYVCRCCRCSKRFKSKIEFILHSCCLFVLLKPARLRRLKTCMHCKFVFLNGREYDKHMDYCNSRKAFCIDFTLTTAEIACQQFVTGRHCFDFDYHLNHGDSFDLLSFNKTLDVHGKSVSSLVNNICCAECGFEQSNLLEFLYHPCIAGKKLTPVNLELILFCCECSCLFVDVFECIEHLKSCSPVSFIFIRINKPELMRVVLRRWSREMADNPYLPPRPVKFRCGECEEIYRQFNCFLIHPCPKRERYERIFIQPLGIMETYTCEICHLVVFSVSEAIEHIRSCKRGRHLQMVQIHYSMDEVIVALAPWMKCPQSLRFNIAIGVGDEADEMKVRKNENLESNALPIDQLLARFHNPQTKPSRRITDWINRTTYSRTVKEDSYSATTSENRMQFLR